jgi:hypothetical protein
MSNTPINETERLKLEKEKLELEQQQLMLEEEESQFQLSAEDKIDPQQRLELMDSPGEAAMRSIQNNISLGFGDEINAHIERGLDTITGQPTKPYNELVAENQARRELLKKYNPVAYGGLATLGTGMTLPLTASTKIVQGLGKAAPLAMNTITGAIEAAGESQGSIMEDPLQLIKDTVMGGAVAAGFSKAGDIVGDKFAKSAPKSALKALGVKPKDVKTLTDAQKDELGQLALDEKVVTAFGGKGGNLERLKSLIASKEAKLGDILNKIDEAGVPLTDRKQLADEIFEKFKKSPVAAGLEESELAPFKDLIDGRLGVGSKVPHHGAKVELPEGLIPEPQLKPTPAGLTNKELQTKKVSLNTDIKDAGFTNQNPGRTLETWLKLRQGLREKIEQNASNASDPAKALLPAKEALNLKQTNQDLGKLFKLEDVVERENLKSMLKPDMDLAKQAGVFQAIVTGDPKGLIAGGIICSSLIHLKFFYNQDSA